jgi:hypothetical protein
MLREQSHSQGAIPSDTVLTLVAAETWALKSLAGLASPTPTEGNSATLLVGAKVRLVTLVQM